MTDQPEHPGCEVCSYTDGGCSTCNPWSVLDLIEENDAAERALTEGADE